MRWKGLRRSRNVTDLRGRGGGRRMIPLPFGRGGGLGLLAVLVVVAIVGGPEALELLVGPDGALGSTTAPRPLDAREQETGDFVTAVLGSTEDVWTAVFAESGARYEPPRLTLFEGAVDSACGYATAAVGPFYCPADSRVYLDTSFFGQLARMGGPGDFARAYVIGHEVGHHVQNVAGTMAEVRELQNGVSSAEANRLQVAVELQADCFAGVWASHANRTQTVLEPGDIEEGLAAAAAIGDDTLQRNAGRRVTPEAFTHGTSAERRQWLERGLASGDPEACDI